MTVSCKHLFVSHSGNDFHGCGNSTFPCASVRFTAMIVSRAGDTINIDHHQGKPYEECKSSLPKWTIVINKTLSFVGRNGKAVIQCTTNHNLFLVTGQAVRSVTFENLLLTKANRVILFIKTPSRMMVRKCNFKGNRFAIVMLAQLNQASIDVHDSTFENNVDIGVAVQAQVSIKANLTENIFDFSNVQFYINSSWGAPWKTLLKRKMQVFISRCKFVKRAGNERKKYKPHLDVAYFAPEFVNITIQESLFSNLHRISDYSNGGSPVILIHIIPRKPLNRIKTRIILDRITIRDNKSPGMAVRIFDFYKKNQNEFDVQFKDCIFHNNANGALEINIQKQDIAFDKMPQVIVRNNVFSNNHYIAKPDHVSYDKSTLSIQTGNFLIHSCRFMDNSQGISSSAAAVYINEAKVVFRDCYFENSQVRGKSVQVYGSARSDMNFVGRNRFNIKKLKSDQKIVHHEVLVPNQFFLAYIRIHIEYSFVVQCPVGYRFHGENKTGLYYGEPGSYMYVSFSCIQCPRKTYSVERGALHTRDISQITCHNCPRGGQCEKGRIKAKPNFWGYEIKEKTEIAFLSCPLGYCCEGEECASYNSCNGNRTGQLCGRCSGGMSEPLFDTKCRQIDGCKNKYPFWTGVSAFLVFAFLFFLFQSEINAFLYKGISFFIPSTLRNHRNGFLNSSESSSFSEENSHATSYGIGYHKIIFYYYQIIHIFKSVHGDENGTLGDLSNTVTKTLNFVMANIGIDCPFKNITPVEKTVLLHSVGMALLVIASLTLLLWKLLESAKKATFVYKKQSDTTTSVSFSPQRLKPNDSRFLNRIICVFIHTCLLMYSSLAELVFTLLRCVPFGDNQILFIDGTVQCYQTFQHFLMAYAAISTLPFFLVPVLGSYVLTKGKISVFQFCVGCLFPLPFCCYWFYLLVRNKTRSQSEGDDHLIIDAEELDTKDANSLSRKAVLAVLSGPFRPHGKFWHFPASNIPWESVFIFRRLVIIVTFTFIHDARLRMLVILIICVAILLSHLYVKPFSSDFENLLESLSLSTLIIICGITLVKVLYHGEDYSSFPSSSKLLRKLNLTESILILAPATLVVLIATICICIKLASLAHSGVTIAYRKSRNVFYSAS